MKNINVFFMLLILLMNCIDTRKFDKDFDESGILQELIFINKMRNPTLEIESSKKCISNCFDLHINYNFSDLTPDQRNCIDGYSSGNGNNKPESGERGIIRIPLTYNGVSKVSNINVTLSSTDGQIIVDRSTLIYPDIEKAEGKSLFSCPLSYYGSWSDSNDLNCKPDSISQCTGWKIRIPNNYTGNFLFKMNIFSSVGSKIIYYSL